ncbi:hypothetical protein BV25DRAFT_1819630 [Artomyces pyxidatus]|uniref:Uncharacterized protein n=1 Tax=Artomyces pyxidatus TaxID=48021 RepID=A0ACB8TFZ8_9AGAM|nr:hypothetical protein BV25DRAFT_1819630 [Artomyces pyxidatus]
MGACRRRRQLLGARGVCNGGYEAKKAGYGIGYARGPDHHGTVPTIACRPPAFKRRSRGAISQRVSRDAPHVGFVSPALQPAPARVQYTASIRDRVRQFLSRPFRFYLSCFSTPLVLRLSVSDTAQRSQQNNSMSHTYLRIVGHRHSIRVVNASSLPDLEPTASPTSLGIC